MYASIRDLILIGTGIGVALILSFLLQKRPGNGRFLARKVLHFLSISFCALAPLSEIPRTWLQIVVLCAAVLLWIVVRFFNFFDLNDSRKSYGIFLFTLPLLLMLLIEEDSFLISMSMAVLALSDPVAALVGKKWKSRVWGFSPESKTLLGSFAFMISSVVLIIMFTHLNGKDWFSIFPGILLLSIGASLSEAVGKHGWDNVFIPLIIWLFAPLMLQTEAVVPGMTFALIAALFMLLSIKKKLLQFEGALLSALMGMFIGLEWGWIWIVPLAVFFLSSALISKIFPAAVLSDAKSGKARDHVQVWSNGGIYFLICWLSSLDYVTEELSMLLMLTSISVATSDTWSSEIGTHFKGKTIDILKWRFMPAGVSGGVSLEGTLGGLTGAGLIGLLALGMLPEINLSIFLWVALFGFAGMLIDSILGSWLQVKYLNENGGISDTGTQQVKGFNRINNDAVNILSNSITILLLWLLYTIYNSL